MNEKSGIYAFYRLGGKKKTEQRIKRPAFPAQSVLRNITGALTWETGFLLIAAFLSGRAVLSGGLFPFPAALLASVMIIIPDRGLWVMAAAIGGLATVTSGYVLGSTSVILLLLFLIIGQARGKLRQSWYGTPLLVTGLITAVKAGVFSYYSPELYNYIITIFEGVLSGCSAFLLIRALPALRKIGGPGTMKKDEILGGAVLVVLFLTGLSELTIAGVEIRNIAARFMVLFAAYTGGSGFGAAMGTLVGIIPSISSAIVPGNVAVYSFSGLTSGIFRSFGRLGICIGFITGNILLSIYLTDYSTLITAFTETALAVGLFAVLPPKRLLAARSMVRNSLFTAEAKPVGGNKVREIMSAKIREYSRIFTELSRAYSEISCDIRVYEENNIQSLFNGIAAKVCRNCSLHRVCWEKEFYKTYRNIMDMLSYIEVNGYLSEENIGPDIQKRCSRLREMAVTVNCLYETYRQARIWQRKLAESKEIVAGQMEGMATIIQNLSDEVKIDFRMREDIEVILRSELAKAGFAAISLNVLGERNDQLEVSLSCPSCNGKKQCKNGIAPLVSRILSQPLTVLNNNYCTKHTGEPVCEFKLLPIKAFTVELGFASIPKNGNLVSGDSFASFDLKDSKFAIVISDGMGVGPKAAVESKATITLLERLLETGFDKNLAVKTVNSILVLGSPDETFATVDLAVLDLVNGSADFVKIGSAPSFVKRGNQVSLIRANSLPIGILNNIEVDSIQQPLGHDDVLVMISDGVLSADDDSYGSESWIMDILQDVMTTDPQNIADLIINKAVQKSGGLVDDDMTVVVTKLTAVNGN